MSRASWLVKADKSINRICSFAPLHDRDRIRNEHIKELESIPDTNLPAEVKKLEDKSWLTSELRRRLDEPKDIAIACYNQIQEKEYYQELRDDIWKKLQTYQLSEKSVEEFKELNMTLFPRRKAMLLNKMDTLIPEITRHFEKDFVDHFLKKRKHAEKLEPSEIEKLESIENTIETTMTMLGSKEEKLSEQSNADLAASTQSNFPNESTLYGKSPKNARRPDSDKTPVTPAKLQVSQVSNRM